MSESKHAFLLVVFNDYKLLEYRLRMLDDPRNTIFLLIDKKTVDFEDDKIRKILHYSEIVFVPRFKIYWAGVTQIKAAMELLASAVKHPKEFKYYHYLMGADLPIKSNTYIHAFFDAHYPSQFLEFEKDAYEFSKYKKSYYHFFVENNYFRTNKLFKVLNHGLAKVQEILRIKRRESKQLYAGSALYSITNEFANYLVERKDQILKEYRWTLSCDEVYLQTEIMASPFKDDINAFEVMMYGNARYIEWKNRNNTNSPTVFTMDDYQRLINADEGLLFARKFSENESMQLVEMIFQSIKDQK